MRGDGHGRVDAEWHRREHGGGDDGSVDKVVKRVADDHHLCGSAVHLTVVSVAMAQQHELLQHEERDDAGEERAEHLTRRQLGKSLGNETEQCDAEQRAHGVTDQPRHELGPPRLIDEE